MVMASYTWMKRFFSLFFALWLPMLLLSCGGGGGGGGTVNNPSATLQTNTVQAGSVAVLLTDNPTDEFSEINITVTGVELLSDEAKVMLFSREKTFDLLKLQNESSLFSVSSDVPPAWYNKIRLHVSKMELVRRDMDGNIIEVIEPKLTGNGKLDLNPRGPFLVEPGGTLILQIDIDAQKSIHITDAGESSQYVFRPVVFVDIIGGQYTGKLVRVEGLVKELNPENRTFDLCPSDTSFRAESVPQNKDYDGNPEQLTEGCVAVHVSDTTSLFDAEGDPAPVIDIKNGDFVSAIGHFQALEDDPGEDHHMLDLDAEVIEIGPFFSLAGTIHSSPDVTETFEFDISPEQGFLLNGPVKALLQNGTKIFSDSGIELSASDIRQGMSAKIDGILVLSDTEPDLLKAALIILNTTEAPPLTEIQGTASNVDYENRGFDLITSTQTVCVKVPMDTLIFLIPSDDEIQASSEGNVEFEYLKDEDKVKVSGVFDATECLVAQTIWIQTNSPIVID